VLPLDVPSLSAASEWIERLKGEVGVFKVGLELFTAAGPAALARVHQSGADCFLDLKLHDIPKTMACAARTAADLGVRYLTLHASAGPRALATTAEAIRGTNTQLLAVSVLTSLDDSELDAVGLAGPVAEAVTRLARLAADAGIQGLVCSARECEPLRQALGPEPLLVVPGIRPTGSAPDDQRRVATPAEAVTWGADLLVVGRPIRDADDPARAARAIVHEIAQA